MVKIIIRKKTKSFGCVHNLFMKQNDHQREKKKHNEHINKENWQKIKFIILRFPRFAKVPNKKLRVRLGKIKILFEKTFKLMGY